MKKEPRLVNKDCLTFLRGVPDGSVDMVLTDFPYYISKKTGFQHGGGEQFNRIKISKDFGKWDKKENEVDLQKVVAEFYRVLRPGGTAIAFYDMWKITDLRRWMEAARFRMIRLVQWHKTNPVPLNQWATYLGNAVEFAVVGVKGSNPVFHGKYDKGFYLFPTYHGRDRFHPTQKPLRLFEDLIEKHSNPGDVVLDCFLGSGTTAVAAVNKGRKIIGCELDTRYYQNMRRRMEEYA